MLTKKRIISLCIFLIFFLLACQLIGGKDIVGRWEFGDQDFGIAYEFYKDGSGSYFSSLDPYYPIVGDFTYTFDPKSGVLNLKTNISTSADTTLERTMIHLVTFLSNDEINFEGTGFNKSMSYARKPLPELPPHARARIGGLMLGKDFELLEAEKLAPGWEADYNDYISIARSDIEITVGEEAEEWLVKLQVEGQENPKLYVLRKGEGRWGVFELVKK